MPVILREPKASRRIRQVFGDRRGEQCSSVVPGFPQYPLGSFGDMSADADAIYLLEQMRYIFLAENAI